MRKVVYSVITGGYDNHNEPNFIKAEDLDYILFTDNKNLSSEFWKIVYLPNKNDIDHALQNREIKINPFEHLKNYDASIYVDGHIEIKKCLNDLFNQYNNFEWVGPEHRHGGNIIFEAFRCFEASKITFDELKEFIVKNISLDLEEIPFPECGFMLRKHNPKVVEFSERWLAMYIEGPRRDQLHWQKAFKEKHINFSYFKFRNIDENPYIIQRRHKNFLGNLVYKKVKNLLRKFLFR